MSTITIITPVELSGMGTELKVTVRRLSLQPHHDWATLEFSMLIVATEDPSLAWSESAKYTLYSLT